MRDNRCDNPGRGNPGGGNKCCGSKMCLQVLFVVAVLAGLGYMAKVLELF